MQPPILKDFETRLARRRALESLHHKGRRAHGHGDFLLRHDRITARLLESALKVTGFYGRGRANALDPVIRHARLHSVRVPPTLDGFRILHLSDLHIDGVEGLTEILAARLVGLEVDLCVFTGDYRFEVYGPCDAIYPRMRRILASVNSRYGVVGILGNHDCADIAVGLQDAGVRMLINDAIEAGIPGTGLWVIGVDDPHYYGCDDLAAAMAPAPLDGYKLLLAHTPEMFAEAAEAGIDLYLSGHTHGGQIRLPWFGAPMLNAACPRAYTHGPWEHRDMQGYTSAGVGCSMLPVRYGCPPEIVVLELKSIGDVGRAGVSGWRDIA